MSANDDLVRLRHMLDYSHDAVKFLEGKTLDDLNSDVMLTRALTYTVGIIGEAASNISREFQDANPQISWPQIIAMRDRLFHGYIDIRYERL
jgi:uncharacterized protein with HEPN domain